MIIIIRQVWVLDWFYAIGSKLESFFVSFICFEYILLVLAFHAHS